MTKIEDIEGIGSTYTKKLVEAGIKTTDDLLVARILKSVWSLFLVGVLCIWTL
ncbi:hypothetical protein MUP77_01555 [Candidatus Bathyarchaeota archaeon]|nr:hypothetical protein [Candidatus Bathyarchaeota archaeon]